jgi:hypothetical protein
MSKKIWVTWEIQRRNRTLSAKFEARLFEFVGLGRGLIRYARSIAATFSMLRAERPEYVFVQNPSIVLSAFMVVMARVFGFVVIVDEHNAGLYPQEGKSRVLSLIAQWIARWANYVIVSNRHLVSVVDGWGGRALVLADPLPVFEGGTLQNTGKSGDTIEVFLVCTWAADEPYQEVLAAMAKVPGVRLHISGKFAGKVDPATVPGNVVLEGFLSDADFLARMRSADAVMVLTKRENCLNCGAYEAVAMNKPMILSDHTALKEYFGTAAIYVDNSVQGIAGVLGSLSSILPGMTEKAATEHERIDAEWQSQFEKVKQTLWGRAG